MISMGSGEAVVYKVIIDGKPYALKLYKPNMPLSDTAKKVIAKIKDNPKDRIIKIYDFGRYNEQDFEIMEYAEGGTLDQYLKSNGAIHDTTKIKNIVKMITEGLQQLHSEYKVIYQDLKPENIYFRDANKTSLVLADFGISSIMEGYDEEVEVTASITDLYAAPELAHKGNRNEVMVTPVVDYFALGITMLELWLGEKPFKGVKATKRDYLIAEEKVDLPIDMPDDYATIIRGLIRPQRKDRWGNEQVRKWLKGEALTVESRASQTASTVYDPLKFSNTESATTPQELAALMEKYPDIGKTCLYEGIIKDWLKKAGDLMLYNEILNITSRYASNKDPGLYTAILALDPERPFKSRGGKICKTTEDIADAIMAESAYYMEELKKPTANLYLYLAATEGSQGKEAADAFCKYFKEYSPKRALTLVYLKLQSDGGITIGSKHYQSPEELKNEKDGAQIALVKKAVNEKDSMLLVWLSDIYGDNLKSTDTFSMLSALEQFFLLGLLPYLSFKEFGGDSWVLQDLIDSYPDRTDLFEIYAAQGLPLTGQDYDDDMTPIDYAVCNFKELSRQHGADTIHNMIRLLHKLGADVNEYSSNGTCPLINAYNANNNDLVKLLLELGADEKQYQKDRQRVEQERKEQEHIAEQKRQERKEKTGSKARAAALIPINGKLTLEDGSVYEGYLVNNIPHGKGKRTWPDREIKDRSPSARIAVMFASLPTTGFDESKLKKITIKGDVYEGDFVNGKANGKGKKTWMTYNPFNYFNNKEEYTYEGDFVDNNFHGKGKIIFHNGDVYEGDFVDGKYNGKGKKTYHDGSVYKGDWVDDKRTGTGKMTYADGSINEGNWKDDKFIDGKDKDKWEFDDNSWYEGDFVNGKPHGRGKRTWRKSGSAVALAVYEGDFINGKQHGKGKITYYDGSFEEGNWRNDEFKGKGPFGLFGRANKEVVEEWERAKNSWKMSHRSISNLYGF